MNLRSRWAGSIADKSISDALETITTRANLIFRREHQPATGVHVFPGTPVPFDPGNFGSTTAGQTWTLTPSQQISYRYRDIGGWIFLYVLATGTVAGAAGTTLRITLPIGVRGPAESMGGGGFVVDGGVGQAAFIAMDGGIDRILVLKANLANWTNGSIQVRFQLFWEQRPAGS